jgi:hypothetical protein
MVKLAAILVGLVVLVALAVAGIAQPSGGSAQYGGPDRLFGGGRFVFDFDSGPGELILARDIGVEASALGGGRSTGTRYYGNPDRTEPAPALSISCLTVDEGSAVIGVTDQQGNRTVQYFEDNGPPGPDPADRITPVFIVSSPEDLALMPKRFPEVCPSVVPPSEWGSIWATLDSGDIAVVDAVP